MSIFTDRCEMERREGWRETVGEVPFFKPKKGWEIKVIPPFGGAVARFIVRMGEATASVYLDTHNTLGCPSLDVKAYWEVYPVGDDVGRCWLGDIGELEEMIETSLLQQVSPPGASDPGPESDKVEK